MRWKWNTINETEVEEFGIRRLNRSTFFEDQDLQGTSRGIEQQHMVSGDKKLMIFSFKILTKVTRNVTLLYKYTDRYTERKARLFNIDKTRTLL
jgi:hypothetical protein